MKNSPKMRIFFDCASQKVEHHPNGIAKPPQLRKFVSNRAVTYQPALSRKLEVLDQNARIYSPDFLARAG